MTAEELRKTLERAGYSISRAARELGISRRMLTYYCSGEWPIPTLVEIGVRSLKKK